MKTIKIEVPTVETIDFKNGIASVSLATLDRTVKLEDIGGRHSPTKPMDHSTLISHIFEKCTHINPSSYIDDIHIYGEKRLKWTGEKNMCPAENYLIEKCISRIVMPVDKDTSPSIAISYTDKGIQVAMGMHVSICANLSIFGADYASTFGGDGNNKMPFEKMMNILTDTWLGNIKEKYAFQFELMNRMKDINVTSDDVLKLYGNMLMQAVKFNAGSLKGVAPMNITEVSEFVRKSGLVELSGDRQLTAWEMVNFGTELLKPGIANIDNLIPKNSAFNDLIIDTFLN